jgi:hypothetical protein
MPDQSPLQRFILPIAIAATLGLTAVVALLFVTWVPTKPEPVYQGVPASRWVKTLGDRNARDRDSARFVLVRMRADGLPYLRPALEGGDEVARGEAWQVCSEVGADAVPFLTPYLDHADQSVRFGAAYSLAWVHVRVSDAPLVTRAKFGDNSALRQKLTTVLRQAERQGEPARREAFGDLAGQVQVAD